MSGHTLGGLVFSFFKQYMTNQRGDSPHTIASYGTCVKLLFEFAGDYLHKKIDRLQLEHFDTDLILKFLDHLETKRDNLPQTRNNRLAAIRTFFRFLATQDPTLKDVCDKICAISMKKTSCRPPTCLDNDEMKAFLEAPDPESLWGARDRALFWLLYDTGARVQEVVNISVADLTLQGLPQVRLLGKGRKERLAPLRADTVKAIMVYLQHREHAGINHSRLFLNRRRLPITRFGIRDRVKSYHKKLKQQCPSLADKIVTPHTFRHTTVLHMVQSGIILSTIRDILGHADINTTQKYATINMAMKVEALNATTPPTSCSDKPVWFQKDVMTFLDDLTKTISAS